MMITQVEQSMRVKCSLDSISVQKLSR